MRPEALGRDSQPQAAFSPVVNSGREEAIPVCKGWEPQKTREPGPGIRACGFARSPLTRESWRARLSVGSRPYACKRQPRRPQPPATPGIPRWTSLCGSAAGRRRRGEARSAGLAVLFLAPRLGTPELALSAGGAVADDVEIHLRTFLVVDDLRRSSSPRELRGRAAFLAAQLHARLDSRCATRPNRPRGRYLSRYPVSTLQRVIAFAGWRALRSGARSLSTPRASPASSSPSVGEAAFPPSPVPCLRAKCFARAAER